MSITTPKVQLLNQISEIDIIRFYIPEFDPKNTGNYKSPFSKKDDHPSLNFYNQNGKLYFKSHNTGHQGDVFQFVADLKGIDCKSNFQGVISAIEADLQISSQPVSAENNKRSLKLSFDKSQAEMIAYFGQFGVTTETLERFNVHQVKYHEFVTSKGKLCKFDYKKLNQLAVCYTIDERIKIYFPEIELVQTKGFGYKDQTKDDVFGLQQIAGQRHERLFLAAGEKDCLVLNQANFTAISLQSENTIPSAATLKAIDALSDNIFIVYDNDEPGQKAAEKLSGTQGWKVINLPNGIKDAAVFFQSHSKEEFEKLISEAIVISSTEGQALPEVYTIFHQTEDFLKKYYDFRYNTVSLDIEYKRKTDKDFQVVNENQLFVTMNKAGIKVGMDKLICILKSDFVAHYNPVTAYFLGLPK